MKVARVSANGCACQHVSMKRAKNRQNTRLTCNVQANPIAQGPGEGLTVVLQQLVEISQGHVLHNEAVRIDAAPAEAHNTWMPQHTGAIEERKW